MKSKNLHVGAKGPGGWGPAAAVAVFIFVASSFPGPHQHTEPFPHWDKVLHASVYGALGAFVARALLGRHALRPAVALAAAVALGTLYGVTDEIHQMFVPRRSPEVGDVIADGIGALLGASALLLHRRGRGR